MEIWIYKFFDEKSSGGTINSEIMSNHQLAEELHKHIIRKFKKQIVYSSFKESIWGSDLYYALLLFIVNLYGLFLWKKKEVLQLLMHLNKS